MSGYGRECVIGMCPAVDKQNVTNLLVCLVSSDAFASVGLDPLRQPGSFFFCESVDVHLLGESESVVVVPSLDPNLQRQ